MSPLQGKPVSQIGLDVKGDALAFRRFEGHCALIYRTHFPRTSSQPALSFCFPSEATQGSTEDVLVLFERQAMPYQV